MSNKETWEDRFRKEFPKPLYSICLGSANLSQTKNLKQFIKTELANQEEEIWAKADKEKEELKELFAINKKTELENYKQELLDKLFDKKAKEQWIRSMKIVNGNEDVYCAYCGNNPIETEKIIKDIITKE